MSNPSKPLADTVVAALNDLKAENIAVININAISSVADYFIIATGSSSRHINALTDRVIEFIKDKGYCVFGTEEDSDWVLLDLGDVVVHIMTQDTRDYYNLEKLWQTSTQASTEIN